jgi:hypothetical protein
MMIVFFSYKGIAHRECTPQDKIINQHFCLKVLGYVHDELCHRWPQRWYLTCDKFTMTIHVPTQPSLNSSFWQNSVAQVIAPSSPDMAPSDIFLVSKLEETFKGKGFYDVDTTEYNAMEQLLAIPVIEIEQCFHHWGEW